MNTTIGFLSAIKARYNLPSDGRLAVMLGLTRSSISRFMLGKDSLGDETSVKVADLLDIDPGYVIACIHAERAKEVKTRMVWERIAEKMAAVAAVLAVVLILPVVSDYQLPPDFAFMAFTASHCILCQIETIDNLTFFSVLWFAFTLFIMAGLKFHKLFAK